jgi:hypothetical protein
MVRELIVEENRDEYAPLYIAGLHEVKDDKHVCFHACHVHGEGGRHCWSQRGDEGIVLKTKPVRWFDQKKSKPKPSPVF